MSQKCYDFSSMIFTLVCFGSDYNQIVVQNSLSFDVICNVLLKQIDQADKLYDESILEYFVTCSPKDKNYVPEKYVVGVLNKRIAIMQFVPNTLETVVDDAAFELLIDDNLLDPDVFQEFCEIRNSLNPDDVEQPFDEPNDSFAYQLHLVCKQFNANRQQQNMIK